MFDSFNELSIDELFSLCNDLRPLLLDLANAKISKEIQSKVGASDIVQQTMLEAYHGLQTFKPDDKQHLFNWLAKILDNNLKDLAKSLLDAEKRSVRREIRLPSGWNLQDKGQMQHSLELQEDLASLSKAMARMPRAHQNILAYKYFERMTYPEIAKLLDRTEDAVRMQANRAIERLAREMRIDDDSSTQ